MEYHSEIIARLRTLIDNLFKRHNEVCKENEKLKAEVAKLKAEIMRLKGPEIMPSLRSN
jgi:cell division protein FtsB